MPRRKKPARQTVRRHFREAQALLEPPVVDWRYWAWHALHWQVFTLVIIAVFFMGFAMLGHQSAVQAQITPNTVSSN